MRNVFIALLLAVTLYACHKDAEKAIDSTVDSVVADAADLAGDATVVDVVDAADAVSAADVPSPVTP